MRYSEETYEIIRGEQRFYLDFDSFQGTAILYGSGNERPVRLTLNRAKEIMAGSLAQYGYTTERIY